MKKLHNLVALLLLLALLLCGCKGKANEGGENREPLLTAAQSAFEGGGIFFAGKVLGKAAEERLITYYDADMGKNTFYSVEVTEDPFGYMPDRVITVCVLGNGDSFPDRTPLSKGAEYYFHTYLWVEGEHVIFLLPTFYTSLAEREEGKVYTTVEKVRYLCGEDAEYQAELMALAEQAGYGPEAVLNHAKSFFEEAAKKSTAEYFKDLKIEVKDPETLKKTQATAKALAQKSQSCAKTYEGVKELIK